MSETRLLEQTWQFLEEPLLGGKTRIPKFVFYLRGNICVDSGATAAWTAS